MALPKLTPAERADRGADAVRMVRAGKLQFSGAQRRVLSRAACAAQGLEISGGLAILWSDAYANRDTWQRLVTHGLLEQRDDRLHITRHGREVGELIGP